MKFEIDFMQNPNEDIRALCEQYWKRDENGKFAIKLRKLEEKLKKEGKLPGSGEDLLTIIQKYSRLYSPEHLCEREGCNEPVFYIKNNNYPPNSKQLKEKICPKCKARDAQQQQQEESAQAEYERKEKEKLMQEAYEKEVYLNLIAPGSQKLIHYNFLVELACWNDIEKARKKIGLRPKDADSIMKELNELHLINYGIGIENFSILKNFETALKNRGAQRVVKSIFSHKAFELYLKLKQDHLFVYPEIPLCAFIDKDHIEHLLNGERQHDLFLKVRVDFLICNEEGKPEVVFEYNGGYHEDPTRIEQDKFKKDLLAAVGIAVREVGSKGLKSGDF